METTAHGLRYTSYSAPKDTMEVEGLPTGPSMPTTATQELLFFTVFHKKIDSLRRTHQAIELKLDTAISHQNTAIITLARLPRYPKKRDL